MCPNDLITLDMLRQYLVDCDKKKIEPTLRGFWHWCRKHNY